MLRRGPELGSLVNFGRVVRVAHEFGLRVTINLVLQHMSDQHP